MKRVKEYIYAFCMCRSMFCAIPCPWNKVWDEEARDKMLVFLPVVGLEMGVLWAGLGWLCLYLQLPTAVTGMVLCAYPFLASGGLHLDGYMDVTDAVKSCRDLEERRRILKDSHVGAFAVIGLVLLVAAQFACCAAVDKNTSLWIFMLIPVVSRCGSALAVMILPSMNTSQYAAQYGGRRRYKGRIAVVLAYLAAALAGGIWLGGVQALALAGGCLGYGLALGRAYLSLEGMSGDVSGYALTISELFAVATLVLVPQLTALLSPVEAGWTGF